MIKPLKLKYYKSAENSDEGWERYSLPLGNGYCGASVFGGAKRERIQFTTNTFANDYKFGGVSNFAEIFLNFPSVSSSAKILNYERGLDLNAGMAYSRYNVYKTKIERKAFFSYPDKIFAYKIDSSDKINFEVELVIPYLDARKPELGGRTGNIKVEGNQLVMRGTLPFRDLIYEGRVAVFSNGKISFSKNKLCVKNTTSAVVYFAMGTSYKLESSVFFDGNHKAIGNDPHSELVSLISSALSLGFDRLYERHKVDYNNLMNRVNFDLGGKEDSRSTEELLFSCKNGNFEPYLIEVYYAYGRYLLMSSSRKGSLPSSLQGVWTVHDKSPWGSGFWHNINVQMNYWHAFTTNLSETFEAYVDFNKAYLPQAEKYASDWIKKHLPKNYEKGKGKCGWIIGTSSYAYEIDGLADDSHSGPATGAMTAKMFWDYYDFTRDEKILKNVTFPAIHGMAKFLTKCVDKYGDRYLSVFSASPEQTLSGHWVNGEKQQYYLTVGCAFDQQFIYENAFDDLRCSKLLNFEDETVKKEKKQINKYAPVQIGYSGQIKEYDEESFYGEIGEAQHRHISQLVGLMPARLINGNTPAWLDTARQTLKMRGDKSTGWALAHRLCSWARIGDGDHAYLLLENLLKERTYPNLWDVHPPFQIDGNFGACAGITEMLLQSHEGYIYLFPSLPKKWKEVSFNGLKARGNFTVSARMKNGKTEFCEITSIVGEKAFFTAKGIDSDTVVIDLENNKKVNTKFSDGVISFNTKKGNMYRITGFSNPQIIKRVRELSASWEKDCVLLKWKCGKKDSCAVYRAIDNDCDYTLLKVTNDCMFKDLEFNENNKKRITYKIVVIRKDGYSSKSEGETVFVNPADRLEIERYKYRFKQNNLNS